MHARREGVAAAAAVRGLARRGHVLVEGHAELGRALEDVEELAEGQPEQGDDHRHGVEEGEELVAVAREPGVAHGQQQAGEADREEQHEGQDVLGEELQRGRSLVAHAAAHGQHHAGDHEEGRPDQAVEDEEGEQGVDGEGDGGEAEDARSGTSRAGRAAPRSGSSRRRAGR